MKKADKILMNEASVQIGDEVVKDQQIQQRKDELLKKSEFSFSIRFQFFENTQFMDTSFQNTDVLDVLAGAEAYEEEKAIITDAKIESVDDSGVKLRVTMEANNNGT